MANHIDSGQSIGVLEEAQSYDQRVSVDILAKMTGVNENIDLAVDPSANETLVKTHTDLDQGNGVAKIQVSEEFRAEEMEGIDSEKVEHGGGCEITVVSSEYDQIESKIDNQMSCEVVPVLVKCSGYDQVKASFETEGNEENLGDFLHVHNEALETNQGFVPVENVDQIEKEKRNSVSERVEAEKMEVNEEIDSEKVENGGESEITVISNRYEQIKSKTDKKFLVYKRRKKVVQVPAKCSIYVPVNPSKDKTEENKGKMEDFLHISNENVDQIEKEGNNVLMEGKKDQVKEVSSEILSNSGVKIMVFGNKEQTIDEENEFKVVNPRKKKRGKKNQSEYYASDIVWAKVRNHNWWPGQIFESSSASDKAMKHFKKHSYLIAYFGDGTFAWNEPLTIKPFHENFIKMVKQSNSRPFLDAIDSALSEVSRRIEFQLSCSCLPEDFRVKSQIIDNSGVKEEASEIECTSEISFLSEEFLKNVKSLALNPCFGIDRLSFVTMRAQLLSFSRWKGYYSLPEIINGVLEENVEEVMDINGVLEEDVKEAMDINGVSEKDDDNEEEDAMDDTLQAFINNRSSMKRKYVEDEGSKKKKKKKRVIEQNGDKKRGQKRVLSNSGDSKQKKRVFSSKPEMESPRKKGWSNSGDLKSRESEKKRVFLSKPEIGSPKARTFLNNIGQRVLRAAAAQNGGGGGGATTGGESSRRSSERKKMNDISTPKEMLSKLPLAGIEDLDEVIALNQPVVLKPEEIIPEKRGKIAIIFPLSEDNKQENEPVLLEPEETISKKGNIVISSPNLENEQESVPDETIAEKGNIVISSPDSENEQESVPDEKIAEKGNIVISSPNSEDEQKSVPDETIAEKGNIVISSPESGNEQESVPDETIAEKGNIVISSPDSENEEESLPVLLGVPDETNAKKGNIDISNPDLLDQPVLLKPEEITPVDNMGKIVIVFPISGNKQESGPVLLEQEETTPGDKKGNIVISSPRSEKEQESVPVLLGVPDETIAKKGNIVISSPKLESEPESAPVLLGVPDETIAKKGSIVISSPNSKNEEKSGPVLFEPEKETSPGVTKGNCVISSPNMENEQADETTLVTNKGNFVNSSPTSENKEKSGPMLLDQEEVTTPVAEKGNIVISSPNMENEKMDETTLVAITGKGNIVNSSPNSENEEKSGPVLLEQEETTPGVAEKGNIVNSSPNSENEEKSEPVLLEQEETTPEVEKGNIVNSTPNSECGPVEETTPVAKKGNMVISKEQQDNIENQGEQDSSPTIFTLKFSNLESVPSITELNKIFSQYGPLYESQTKVITKTNRVNLIFKKREDAESAFSKAGKFSIFGPSLMSYCLKPTPQKESSKSGLKSVKSVKGKLEFEG